MDSEAFMRAVRAFNRTEKIYDENGKLCQVLIPLRAETRWGRFMEKVEQGFKMIINWVGILCLPLWILPYILIRENRLIDRPILLGYNWFWEEL